MPCSGLLDAVRRRQEFERLERDKKRLTVEAECLRKTAEIREFLEKYGEKKE